jgi:glutamine amidotransferase
MKIGIINSGFSNIASVQNALNEINVNSELITSNNSSYDLIIMPGIGNFGYAMESMRSSFLFDMISNYHQNKKPIIGICLGMQLLFESSDESPSAKGFGFLDGHFEKLDAKNEKKCNSREPPNIGYNNVNFYNNAKINSLDGLDISNGYYYFLHSYALNSPQKSYQVSSSSTFNGKEFTPFLIQDNICAIQFHPERSGLNGLNLLSLIINHFRG